MIRRRTVVQGLAALPFATSIGNAFAQTPPASDTISADDGDITVHAVKHASLVLQWGAHVIYVDPVGGAKLYENLPVPTIILITHIHGDHFDPITLLGITGDAIVAANPEVYALLSPKVQASGHSLANGEKVEINGVNVEAIAAYNISQDRLSYHPKGVGNGYLITLGGKRIYVAGDTEPTPEMMALTDIDAAFLPMNLPYTMTPEQAADAVNFFQPALAYPYHYGQTDLSRFSKAVTADTQVRLLNWYP
jgi:L-ascorbate metabolism protein UlaG (beta-lactamase superfamily)